MFSVPSTHPKLALCQGKGLIKTASRKPKVIERDPSINGVRSVNQNEIKWSKYQQNNETTQISEGLKKDPWKKPRSKLQRNYSKYIDSLENVEDEPFTKAP